jgi:hypothetical protein
MMNPLIEASVEITMKGAASRDICEKRSNAESPARMGSEILLKRVSGA